ncbi:MAG: CRISPR-associated endonuclease Cas2 [Patescibacteria group bacterium]
MNKINKKNKNKKKRRTIIKGEVLLRILSDIEDRACSLAAAVPVVLSYPHRGKFLEKISRKNFIEIQKVDYQKTISKLKKEGLVERNREELTKKGKEKIRKLGEQLGVRLFLKNHTNKPSSQLIIVAYDVPEKYKRERHQLRCLLVGLGFKMKQKSFWCGKVKLPKEFFYILIELGINHYVEVFSVDNNGNLNKMFLSLLNQRLIR